MESILHSFLSLHIVRSAIFLRTLQPPLYLNIQCYLFSAPLDSHTLQSRIKTYFRELRLQPPNEAHLTLQIAPNYFSLSHIAPPISLIFHLYMLQLWKHIFPDRLSWHVDYADIPYLLPSYRFESRLFSALLLMQISLLLRKTPWVIEDDNLLNCWRDVDRLISRLLWLEDEHIGILGVDRCLRFLFNPGLFCSKDWKERASY